MAYTKAQQDKANKNSPFAKIFNKKFGGKKKAINPKGLLSAAAARQKKLDAMLREIERKK